MNANEEQVLNEMNTAIINIAMKHNVSPSKLIHHVSVILVSITMTNYSGHTKKDIKELLAYLTEVYFEQVTKKESQ